MHLVPYNAHINDNGNGFDDDDDGVDDDDDDGKVGPVWLWTK